MKNYLKFGVAVFGITLAIFSSINVTAKPVDNVRCKGTVGHCGWTSDCTEILGEQEAA